MDVNKRLKNFPIGNVIELIRKKWVIHILQDLFFGKKYFKEFKQDRPNLSNKVLSNCLKDMEKNGLIKRISDRYNQNVEYFLTRKGRALNKILYELAIFSVDEEEYSEKTRCELKNIFKEKLL